MTIDRPRVLVLGGTAEARALAQRLVDDDVPVISSLAGRVGTPRLPVGEVRVGGFGGVNGLGIYLREARITAVIDATHPFATTMTANGAAAAKAAALPFLRYARPGWSAHPDADNWHWVDTYDEARHTAERLGDRPFVTTGRQTLRYFLEPWATRTALVRIVEPLTGGAPPSWTIIHDRGPYDVTGEATLMQQHNVDVLLSKDSGGSYTSAKLTAARQAGVPVVVVRRPAVPSEAREVDSLDAVMEWLKSVV